PPRARVRPGAARPDDVRRRPHRAGAAPPARGGSDARRRGARAKAAGAAVGAILAAGVGRPGPWTTFAESSHFGLAPGLMSKRGVTIAGGSERLRLPLGWRVAKTPDGATEVCHPPRFSLLVASGLAAGVTVALWIYGGQAVARAFATGDTMIG